MTTWTDDKGRNLKVMPGSLVAVTGYGEKPSDNAAAFSLAGIDVVDIAIELFKATGQPVPVITPRPEVDPSLPSSPTGGSGKGPAMAERRPPLHPAGRRGGPRVMSTEDPKPPVSLTPLGDTGQGPQGASPRSSSRGALPDGRPSLGRAAHPVPGISPSTGAGCAQAPSPSSASSPAPSPGDGGGGGESQGGGATDPPPPGPSPASPGNAAPGLAGRTANGPEAMKAVRKATAAKNARQRRERQRPWTAKQQPGYQPGGNRREPGGGDAA